MKANDQDFVDVLLGSASDATQKKVKAASQNPDECEDFEMWSEMISSVRENQTASRLHETIKENTLAELKASHQFDAERMSLPA